MSRNPAIDRLKGLSAALVVLIHAPPLVHSRIPALSLSGWALQCLCLCAVPYFFILNGYFAAGKWEHRAPGSGDLLQSISRILRLYVPWFVLYLLLDAATGRSVEPVAVLRRFAGFSDGRLETTGYHLWFLPSLVLAHATSWLLRRATGSPLPALGLGAALLAALSISDLLGATLPWGLQPNEGLDLSLFGFCLGTWIRSALPSIRPGPRLRWIPIGICLLLVECALLRHPGSLAAPPFSLLRFAVPALLVVVAVGDPEFMGRGAAGRLLDILGRHSTGIYVAHLAFLYLIPFDSLVVDGFARDNLARWSVCLVLSVAASAAARRSRIPFLRSLAT